MLGGAVVGGVFNYGYQVFQNYQHGLRGGAMFTSICTQELVIAAISGAVGGAVGYALGPLTAMLTRTGFVGSLLAGALEGSASNVAATALVASLTGQPITPGMLFRSGVEGGIGGTVGGGVGWMVKRAVQIIGFRGVGLRSSKYAGNYGYQAVTILENEHALIKAGHVGISFDKGENIFGFFPTAKNMSRGAELEAGGSVAGQVRNDTWVFQRAQALEELTGFRTRLYQESVWMSNGSFLQDKRDLMREVQQGPFLTPPCMYRWPARDGSDMPHICDNCATWPRTHRIPLPEYIGQLSRYMALLKEPFISPWK